MTKSWVKLHLEVHPDLIAAIDRIGEQMTLTRPEVLQKAVQMLTVGISHKIYVEMPGEPEKIRELEIT